MILTLGIPGILSIFIIQFIVFEMNRIWFFTSFCITCFFLISAFKKLDRYKSLKKEVVKKLSEENIREIHFKDIKSFMNSSIFPKLSYDEREKIVKSSLLKDSRKIYDCLLYRNKSKCFTFNDKQTVYADKIYKKADMVMKYPHTYHTLINNPTACSDDTYVVIGSPVGPRQFAERIATRETWGGIKEVDGKKVIHLFFMGQDEDDEENDRMLREENAKYHDLIQFDMKNHFMNLTLLAILTYNWTSTFCPHIAYYVRCDNDMWYNPRLHIRTFLQQRRSATLIGNIITGNKPVRVMKSRYWMPNDVFPGRMFDPYPSGCFVTIAGDTLKMIVDNCVKLEKIIYFDDVFLGMVASYANLTLLTYPGNTLFMFNQAYNPSSYSKMSAAHRYAPADLMALWQVASR